MNISNLHLDNSRCENFDSNEGNLLNFDEHLSAKSLEKL
jgi:hypothetical protein